MSNEEIEPLPRKETTQTNEREGEGEADKTASPSVVQPVNREAEKPNTDESEEETDRKQDESIASLAEQTDWVAKQAKWAKYQVVSSIFLGAVTLTVLVYHGWIMGRQSQAMSEQTAIMKGQLESMNSGSAQTDKMITAMQKQAEAATAQASTSQSLTEQNKDLVDASLAQAEAAKKSVGAAQASARAAEKGAQIAQESFYIGDRPYVFTGYFAIKELTAGVKPEILFVFTNTGKTPALGFKFAAIATIAVEPSPAKDAPHGLQFLPRFAGFPGSNGIIPAGEKIAATADWDGDVPSATTIQEIKNSTKFLFVYGYAIYTDGLGKPHTLKFCWAYMNFLEMFGPCEEFNSTS